MKADALAGHSFHVCSFRGHSSFDDNSVSRCGRDCETEQDDRIDRCGQVNAGRLGLLCCERASPIDQTIECWIGGWFFPCWMSFGLTNRFDPTDGNARCRGRRDRDCLY